jgi:hypothetical protein
VFYVIGILNCPWRAIIRVGNVYRRDYDNVAEQFVWHTKSCATACAPARARRCCGALATRGSRVGPPWEYLADPTKGVPADGVLKRIKSRRGARKPE